MNEHAAGSRRLPARAWLFDSVLALVAVAELGLAAVQLTPGRQELGARDRAQLVAIAYETGLVVPGTG